jgi:hypothetical protein
MNMVIDPPATRTPECVSDLVLDRLVAGELDARKVETIERHAGGCAACAERLARARRGFDAWPGEVQPAALWAQVEQALARAGAASSFFSGIDADAREHLMQYCRILELGVGDELTREGDAELEMYVILDGVFDVTAGGQLIDARRQGDVVGEIAFLTDGRRTATVRAGTPARVLVLRDQFLEKFTQAHPAAGYRLMMNLARIVAGRFAEKVRTLAGMKANEAIGT